MLVTRSIVPHVRERMKSCGASAPKEDISFQLFLISFLCVLCDPCGECFSLLLSAATPLEGIPASLYVAMKGKKPFPTTKGVVQRLLAASAVELFGALGLIESFAR
jgi:hypothetical protein